MVFTILFFFFNDTATTEIYTLSLHDALPIRRSWRRSSPGFPTSLPTRPPAPASDRKSTRLNSSHMSISYAVFCLKKKKYVIASLDVFAACIYKGSEISDNLGIKYCSGVEGIR